MTITSQRKLTLADIADAREYERGRVDFRTEIIALKKLRRVGVGPYVTFLFENRQTIRFQIQEMVRAEKNYSDEGIETELEMYNPLIPEPGALAATMFIELTSDGLLREWLPKLVGIETRVVLRAVAASGEVHDVRCVVDPDHAKSLTRDELTAAVHYVHFEVPEAATAAIESGSASLIVDHDNYSYETPLGPDTVAELLTDLRP